MNNTIYPWQEHSWQQLQQLRARLPHAILFHGPQGIGKIRFLEQFAQALLCEQQTQSNQSHQYACGSCASCLWFAQSNHPDYRCIRPESMETAPSDEGKDSVDNAGNDDSADGEKNSKKSKAPSKEIKIDQIRALTDFMNVSTHRQGLRVVVLYPAEALNHAASNALLKTLEEPPPGTIFLVLTHSIDRLLPTILSRCHKFDMPMPAHSAALAWLQEQGVQDAQRWLAEQGGAPLAALTWAQAGNREEVDALLQVLERPDMEAILKIAEKLQKTSNAQLIELLKCLQRWLYDMIAYSLSGQIRYYPQHQAKLARLAGLVPATTLLSGLKVLNERCAIAQHPLSPRLFIEDMLLDYRALFV